MPFLRGECQPGSLYLVPELHEVHVVAIGLGLLPVLSDEFEERRKDHFLPHLLCVFEGEFLVVLFQTFG